MVLLCVPRMVQGFLSVVSDSLGGPQVRHLNLAVTALLMVGSAKLKTLADAVGRLGRHRTSLGHFFSRAFWPEADVLETAAMTILKSMKPRRGEIISLIIDDTRIAKRGRAMPALSRLWDHSNGRFCHGHTVVVRATHHALKAVGAQAKQPHQDVPLPTFQQRLATFRQDMQREQITQFANRIRQPKVRNRVKELLLAM